MMEVRTTPQKEHSIGDTPHAFVKHGRLSAGRNQRDPVSMLYHAPQPFDCLAPKGWIAPNASLPLLRQAIIFRRVMIASGIPWANDW
jgi:hypothetical protein